MQIAEHRYGKERIRLTALDRSVTPHRLVVCAVDVSLGGDFSASLTAGDNRRVIATDSMKNTVYVMAREHGVESIEQFAVLLVRHFGETYDAVSSAQVDIEQELWAPMAGPDSPYPSALIRCGPELNTAAATYEGGTVRWSSGLDQLQVVKTANSGFSDFHRDRFATLADTDDRLFATSVRAEWRIAPETTDGASDRRAVAREAMLKAFAEHDSRSVQETLYAMGEAAFAAVPEMDAIHLQLPNQHHLLVDLEAFALDNPNRVFVGTDEPFGNIEATLER